MTKYDLVEVFAMIISLENQVNEQEPIKVGPAGGDKF